MISARPLRGVDFPTDGAGNMHPALCNNEGEMHSDLQDHLDLVVSAPSETWRLCGNSSGVQGWMVMTENLVRAVRPAAGQAHDSHQADCDPERELLGGRLTLALNETSTGLCFSSPPLAEGLNHNQDRRTDLHLSPGSRGGWCSSNDATEPWRESSSDKVTDDYKPPALVSEEALRREEAPSR